MMDFEKIINDSVDTGLKAENLPDTPENRANVLFSVHKQLSKELEPGPIRSAVLATVETLIIDLQNQMNL